MVGYSLEIRRSAARELATVEPRDLRRRLVARIQALAAEPRPAGAQKLAGSSGAYRVRQGGYRVVYETLESERRVVIVKIGHRREIYR